MNILIKIIATLTILFTLTAIAAINCTKSFLRDTLELHGASISGATVTAKDITGFLASRTLDIQELSIEESNNSNSTALITIAFCHLQWQKELSPDFSRNSLLPTLLPVDDLIVKNIVIKFDADTEGENLAPLKKNIAIAANHYLKKRLNALSNTSAAMPQLFTFQNIKIQDIKVNVTSRQDPSFQKTFDLPDMQLTATGINEGGLSFPEVVDTITHRLNENIYQTALANGTIKPPTSIEITEKTPPKKRARESSDNANESPEEQPKDGKIKQSAKTVGEGFKTIGRGVKKLFQ